MPARAAGFLRRHTPEDVGGRLSVSRVSLPDLSGMGFLLVEIGEVARNVAAYLTVILVAALLYGYFVEWTFVGGFVRQLAVVIIVFAGLFVLSKISTRS